MSSSKKRILAVAGNPNSGKTTLFNALTGSNQKTGNWPGVTVERKSGTCRIDSEEWELVDLPGIYSLSAHSEDERVARDYLLSGEPEGVLNVLDATNLERNMFLTLQLIEMRIPVVVILNMVDLAERDHIRIHPETIREMLGCPVLAVSAVNPADINLVRNILSHPDSWKTPGLRTDYPESLEELVSGWMPALTPVAQEVGADPRWLGLELAGRDPWVTELVRSRKVLNEEQLEGRLRELEESSGDMIDVLLADGKYGYINQIGQEAVFRESGKITLSDRLDKLFLNRLLGIPLFLSVMYLVFWFTVYVGGSFIDFFDQFAGTLFVDGFSRLLMRINTPGFLVTFLAYGIGSGLQTAATFVPITLTMFIVLAVLEDSGYMSRAAFVMDRLMRFLGLPGKAFVPMLVGFGCTVPAIMGTRTLEEKRDRYLTIFMTPLMSCGARLPVYALFGAVFFGNSSGNMVFSLYLVGILFSVLTGLLVKNTLFKGEPSSFIMELPPYHIPRFGNVMKYAWAREKHFIKRAGKMIILLVTALTFLNSFGYSSDTGFTTKNTSADHSLLAIAGKAVTPLFRPMGITEHNWPATVGLFSGLFAKESVVMTLDTLYSLENNTIRSSEGEQPEEDTWTLAGGLRDSLTALTDGLSDLLLPDSGEENGESASLLENGSSLSLMTRYFPNRQSAYAYLLFILIYFPCLAAFGAMIQEMGPFMAWLEAIYLTILGWITSTLYYQIAAERNGLWITTALGLLLLLAGSFILIGRRVQSKGKSL